MEEDAHQLEFVDASFDTVVCTFGLCAIPDDGKAIAEMRRVLRPGGILVLGDHVASPYAIVRGVQKVSELVSIPLGGEHFRRRPLPLVKGRGADRRTARTVRLGARREPHGPQARDHLTGTP